MAAIGDAVVEANAALDSGDAHRCVLALAALTTAVEAGTRLEIVCGCKGVEVVTQPCEGHARG